MAPLSEYFPKRPIRLRLHLVSWSVALLGMLFGLGCATFSILALRTSVPNFRDELRLNGNWVPSSRVVRMGGRGCRHEHPLVVECEYTINYAIDDPSAPGRTGFKRLDYWGLFEGADESIPLEVHYDSTAPDRVSTNRGVKMLPYRLLGQAVAQLLAIYLAVMMILKSLYLPRKIRDIWAAGQDPTPIAVKFLKTVPTKFADTVFYTWTDLNSGKDRKAFTTLRKPKQPFWLDAGHKTMLALLSPKGNAYLLDANLEVTDLTIEERNRLMQLAPMLSFQAV